MEKLRQSLGIPQSQNIVDVSVIDSTADLQLPLQFFVHETIHGHDMLVCPSFAFLIKHPQGKVVFDLGFRTDKESFPPVVRKGMAGMTLHAEKDIATILQEEGQISLGDIDSIVLSHSHVDHIGDPSTFPPTVDLVVGRGFKDAFLPGYPANPWSDPRERLRASSPRQDCRGILDTGLEANLLPYNRGRQLREVDFETGLKIGELRALDYFSDGSFYLLDAPGHDVGHMCALARTTPSTFIFMGADGCHHCGFLRPNIHSPLPTELSPSPFSTPPYLPGSICPGAVLEAMHPKHSRIEPYYDRLSSVTGCDIAQAEATISKMIPFDACEDVFVIIAHDSTLLDVIDFFPKNANEWQAKGWKKTSQWRFLVDFQRAAARTHATV